MSYNSLISGTPYPYLKISRAALKNNIKQVKNICNKNIKILWPVKANAYGCGIDTILPLIREMNIDYLGVANPFEGKLIRDYGYQGKILNLGGFYPENFSLLTDYDIIPSITDLWQIDYISKKIKPSKAVDIHIKLDLGMGRMGIKQNEIFNLIKKIKKTNKLHLKGIFTHFPESDNIKAKSNSLIVESFNRVSNEIIDSLKYKRSEVILHAANSYAMLLNQSSHFDMVRPGLFLYGYFQNEKDRILYGRDFKIKPSISMYAKPVSVRTLNSGDSISYGSTYKVEKNGYTTGVLPIGYADGIPRALSNKINFQNFPLHGRITMDQIILGKVKYYHKEIELLGKSSPSLEYWADLSNTVTYEIMTKLGHRLNRILV